MKKLAIVSTHPIQYYAPLFKLLSEDSRFSIKVFYTWGEESIMKHDPGFNRVIEWDIPLLDGYNYEFLDNVASSPGSHHFAGIINPKGISAINSFSPDCILVFGWSYKSHLEIIRHFSGKIPVWFRGDSTLLDEKSGVRSILKKPLLKWVYSHIDKAFYVGEHNKVYFQKYGLKASQLVYCPHSIDNTRFCTDHSIESEELRRSFGLTERDILILFAGKLEKKKSPDLLLEAVLELNRPDVHLLFVGNGALEQKLKHKVQQPDVQTAGQPGSRINIHFLDFQNQKSMPVIYQACNLFCLPSSGPGETWGLAVNEAMAARKAILVSTKVGCGPDLIKPGENGAVFEADNKSDLISKLRDLLDKTILLKLGLNSGRIIKDWSFDSSLTSITSELENLS